MWITRGAEGGLVLDLDLVRLATLPGLRWMDKLGRSPGLDLSGLALGVEFTPATGRVDVLVVERNVRGPVRPRTLEIVLAPVVWVRC